METKIQSRLKKKEMHMDFAMDGWGHRNRASHLAREQKYLGVRQVVLSEAGSSIIPFHNKQGVARPFTQFPQHYRRQCKHILLYLLQASDPYREIQAKQEETVFLAPLSLLGQQQTYVTRLPLSKSLTSHPVGLRIFIPSYTG